jgi:hypothetical protein
MRNTGEAAFLVKEHTPWVEVFTAAVKQTKTDQQEIAKPVLNGRAFLFPIEPDHRAQ